MRPGFGKILNRIQIYPAHALSRVFSLSIESFRMPHALPTDSWLDGLMGIMQKTVKMAKNTGLDQFQRQKAGTRSQMFQSGT